MSGGVWECVLVHTIMWECVLVHAIMWECVLVHAIVGDMCINACFYV